MSDQTQNYGFVIPAFNGPTTWHDAVNNNFKAIDAAIYNFVGLTVNKGAWANGTAYAVSDRAFDINTCEIYQCLVAHTSAATGTFAAHRTANPTHWVLISLATPTYMLKSVYDPTNKAADAFAMGNMTEGADAKVMTAAERTKLGFVTVTQAVNLDTMETDVAASKVKTDWITVTQAVNLDTMESDIAAAAAELAFIAVTQAVDLDAIEARVDQLQTDDTPQFAGINFGHATDTTVARAAAGFLEVEGKRIPSPASQAANDLLYRGATEWERLAIGTEGQALIGSSTPAPAWANRVTAKTVQATTSGTVFDFTGIPPSTKLIILALAGVSLDGTDDLLIQIGDAGGIETSGYESAASTIFNAASPGLSTSTAGFNIRPNGATRLANGLVVLANLTGNYWAALHAAGSATNAMVQVGGGYKELSAALTQVRLTRSGTNNFDAGQVNVLYM